MAEVLGPMTIVQQALPTGVDGAKIAQWALREGVTVQQFVNMAAAALGGVNRDLVSKWGWLFSLTEQDHLSYPDGAGVTMMPEITDMDDPDMVHGTTIGHMIGLKPYGDAIGGTWRFFRDARQSEIESTMRGIVNRAIWRWEYMLLNRALTNTENAIGSSGYDVPFVAGTAGNVDFTPYAYAGQTFATSHNHFIGYNASTPKTFADVLEGLAATLEEHGHTAPFTAMVSKTDVATFNGLANIVQKVEPIVVNIDRGGSTSGAQYFANGAPMVSDGVFAYYKTAYGIVELRSYYRIPTGYVGMYKSYGQLDPRNPLRVRVHPNQGFGLWLSAIRSDNELFPLKKLNIEFEFGVSTGEDRTNGAVGYLVAGGSYSNPTIT